jgi:putative oxidoreductase
MAKVDTHELITPSPDVFAGTDRFAIQTGDAFALVGRVLLGWLFIASSWPPKVLNVGGFAGYLTALGLPAPEFWAWVGACIELIIGLTMIFGVATRYSALAGLAFVLIATALAHRYWEYPAPQQAGQYVNFLKNWTIIGGLLLLYVTGAGRFSVDGWLRKRG